MGLAWDASLTDAGVSMISQWAQGAGDRLTITKAVIGEGIVAASQLHLLTQLTDEKSTISIQGFESVANGVKLKLKKTSQGITTSFTLNQIGVYAKLDTSGGTPIIAETLIGVYQQNTGVLIPTEADAPDFAFTFFGTIQTNYSGDLTINVDTSALLSQDDIADNLVTADATMALSANMGRLLADNLAANEESGAKNQNVYPYKDTTKTENGVTFTDNGDGTITVSAASYPYTVSSDAMFVCSYFMDNKFKAGTWTLNGSPIVSDDVYINYVVHYGGEYLNYLDKGQAVTFTQAVDTEDAALVIMLKSGYVLAGALLFKPMLRDARILDDTFVPFAPTNRELMSYKANGKVGAKNLWDIEGWLNKNNQSYTKSDSVFTIPTSADLSSNPFVFSDVNISVTLSASVAFTASAFDIELLDTNNNVVGSLGAGSGTVTTSGCKIRFNNPYMGQTVTLTDPMLRIAEDTDPTFAPYAKTNQQLTKDVSGVSNRNFVDNPFFTVNQRGATTVTSGYGADRWKYSGGNEAVFSSSGVTLNSVLISQLFEKQLPNGVYTASARFSDGTIRKGTATKSNDSSAVRFVEDADFKLTYEPSLQRFDINTAGLSSGLTVRAVKLEVGSVSTLHLDTEPNYVTEYLKCRRYFKRFKGEFGIGCVREYNTSPISFLFRIKIPNDVPMRINNPTVVVNGDIRIPDYAGFYTGSDLINVSGAKDSSVINMDIYSTSTLPVQTMTKGMAANVDVYRLGPDPGTLDLVDEL